MNKPVICAYPDMTLHINGKFIKSTPELRQKYKIPDPLPLGDHSFELSDVVVRVFGMTHSNKPGLRRNDS